MSEIYNPERGQFEEQFDTQTDFIVPELTEDERADAEFLCLFGRSSNDPIDFVASCERDVQIHAYDLYDSGLELSNPGVQINFSERDLPLSVLMDVLVQKDLIHSRVCNQYEYIQGFRERRDLPTGGALLLDTKLQMRGMAQATMADRVSVINRKITGAVSSLCAMQLGIFPSLQLYSQSNDARLESLGKAGFGQYTPDITARGNVAGLCAWRAGDPVYAGGWDGRGRPHAGTRVAVVKNPTA